MSTANCRHSQDPSAYQLVLGTWTRSESLCSSSNNTHHTPCIFIIVCSDFIIMIPGQDYICHRSARTSIPGNGSSGITSNNARHLNRVLG
jgi:hypothetical protein